MCGIVGYVGEGHAKERIIDGLKRLEYRGYDSAGIALPINGRIEIRKHVGEIKNLEKIIGDPAYDSSVGIGHIPDGRLMELRQISMHIPMRMGTIRSL